MPTAAEDSHHTASPELDLAGAGTTPAPHTPCMRTGGAR